MIVVEPSTTRLGVSTYHSANPLPTASDYCTVWTRLCTCAQPSRDAFMYQPSNVLSRVKCLCLRLRPLNTLTRCFRHTHTWYICLGQWVVVFVCGCITHGSSTLSWTREREREIFYLTTHSTHVIYGYMASDIWLRTILIVRQETRCRHIGYSYRLTARVLLYAPSHRQDNTYHGLCYTSRGALAGTRNSSMGRPGHTKLIYMNYLLLKLHWTLYNRSERMWPRARASAHAAMCRRIDPRGGPIELFFVPASAPRLAVCTILSVGWCI